MGNHFLIEVGIHLAYVHGHHDRWNRTCATTTKQKPGQPELRAASTQPITIGIHALKG